MLKQLSIVLFLAVIAVYAQDLDLNFCDPNKIPIDPKPVNQPKLNASANFQMTVEINSESFSQQVHEYYDGSKKVGVVHERVGNTSFTAYSYYDVNQLILIEGANCLVLNLNESSAEVPFGPVNGYIVPTILALPMQMSQAVYIGQKSVIRSIPVNEWQGCYYDSRDQTTNRITFSYSDPDQWLPVDYTDDEKSVLVQIYIESKNKSSDYVSSKTVSVLSFSPFLEQTAFDFVTPRGLYCKNRPNTKELPTIPRVFSLFGQNIARQSADVGEILNLREEYDYEHKLFRYDAIGQTIIQDFSTGLSYVYNREMGVCFPYDTNDLESGQFNNSVLQMKDPNSFFDFDVDSYHYIGKKLQDSVLCNVWIGEKTINGNITIVEWYFLSEGWAEASNGVITNFNPVPIAVYRYKKSSSDLFDQTLADSNHIFAWQRGLSNIVDFEFSSCKNGIDKKYFIFTLSKKENIGLARSLYQFKQQAILELRKIARVVILRLSNPEVDYTKDKIIVTFTLYDKAPKYGNVTAPTDDVPLTEAMANLKAFFDREPLVISYNVSFNKMETYTTDKDGFKEVQYRSGAYSIDVETITEGYSGGAVFLAIAVFAVLGITIGILLIILHQNRKITLPLIDRFKS